MVYERFKAILENEVIPLFLKHFSESMIEELYIGLESLKTQIEGFKKYPMAISVFSKGKEYIIILYPTSHEIVEKKTGLKRHVYLKIKSRHSAMLAGKYGKRYKKLVIGEAKKLRDKIVKENYFKENKSLWLSLTRTLNFRYYIDLKIVEVSDSFAMVVFKSPFFFDYVYVFTPLGILFFVHIVSKEKIANLTAKKFFKGNKEMEDITLKLLSGEIDLEEFITEEKMFNLSNTF